MKHLFAILIGMFLTTPLCSCWVAAAGVGGYYVGTHHHKAAS